jgi:hypothetical protein
MATRKEEQVCKGLEEQIVSTKLGKRREVGHNYVLRYADLKTDIGGWVDAAAYVPMPYDVLHLKVKREGELLKDSLPGWWSGGGWGGRKLKPNDEILYWKRQHAGVPE